MNLHPRTTHVNVKRAGIPKRITNSDVGFDDTGWGLVIVGVLTAVCFPVLWVVWNLRGRKWAVVQWHERSFRFDEILETKKFSRKIDAQREAERLNAQLPGNRWTSRVGGLIP